MGLNTDLAIESYRGLSDEAERLSGVTSQEYRADAAAAKVSRTEIKSDEAAQKLGKPKGLYITLETDLPLGEYAGENAESERVRLLAKCIGEVCRHRDKLFVLGLGNRAVTPDALGPLAIDKILATRHIKRLAAEHFMKGMSEVAAAAAGVMAQTGIESQEIAAAICEKISPKQILVCDALACGEPEHMGRTIQLCSTGIAPGSGVENSRAELSEQTLGAPVAAIGIPTVSRLMSADPRFDDLLITPKQIDRLVALGSQLIADAVNLCFQPCLTTSEVRSLI